jgi:uracil-DNA glycosylase
MSCLEDFAVKILGSGRIFIHKEMLSKGLEKNFEVYENIIDQFAVENASIHITVVSEKLRPFLFVFESESSDEPLKIDLKKASYLDTKLSDFTKTFFEEDGFGYEEHFSSFDFTELDEFLVNESKENAIYPPMPQIYTAFKLCPLDKVNVVIIGMDPYYGEGQAMGLAFSVSSDCAVPQSLRNIYKELEDDGYPVEDPNNGDLSKWSDQGVLLINAALTVRDGKSGSHSNEWSAFAQALLSFISSNKDFLVVVLWGGNAQKLEKCFNSRHKIIKSAHPSPLSAHKGFFGSKPFSKINNFLKMKGLKKIDW